MGVTTIGRVITGDHDIHVRVSPSARSLANASLYWGSNSSTDYGYQPYGIVSNIVIPQRRAIISAKGITVKRGGGSTVPNTSFSLERTVAAQFGASVADENAKVFFPALAMPLSSVAAEETIESPDVAHYVQELVLDPAWNGGGTALGIKWSLEEPYYTGSQQITQTYAYEADPSKAMRLQVVYSQREVQSADPSPYSSAETNSRASHWQGHRFRLAQKTTVNGLWGGSQTSSSFVALYSDLNGTANAVLAATGLGSNTYGVRRIPPLVLDPGWYWVACGASASHTTMRRLASDWSPSSFVQAHSATLAEWTGPFTPGTSAFGTSSAFVGTTTANTSTVPMALGIDYVIGDANVDDFSAPIIGGRVTGGF